MSEPTSTPRRRLPSRRATVLAGTAASVALAGATRTTWIDATAPDLTGTVQPVSVLGADTAPAVLALALVAIAASLATSLSSAWVRFLTGPVLLLTGGGAAVSALGVLRAPEDAAGAAVTSATAVAGSAVSAEPTAWPLLALVPALLVALLGVLVLLAGGGWPRRTRYRSPAVAVSADPSEDPAAAWDALTRGEDPSLEGPSLEDPDAEEDPRNRTAERAPGSAEHPEDEAPPAAR